MCVRYLCEFQYARAQAPHWVDVLQTPCRAAQVPVQVLQPHGGQLLQRVLGGGEVTADHTLMGLDTHEHRVRSRARAIFALSTEAHEHYLSALIALLSSWTSTLTQSMHTVISV